ncbi:MAG: dihydroorotate dehydrogenase electron transfer subunit [Bacteroidaceae bacterium]|nr:dihydroorotate dehydrogenase electron transfer subunit [Bacteroidaceae bacterium]
MKKFVKDLTVAEVEYPHKRYVLLKLTDNETLPEMLPGQFVEVKVEGSQNTFLRRPISINYVDRDKNQLWLLIQTVGDGTHKLAELKVGDKLNIVFPLGNGFSPVQKSEEKVLLVGGGVGVAPLLNYGKMLKEAGACPVFLLGARSKVDLLEQDMFKAIAPVYVTTEDGSEGEKGFVTQHSILDKEIFDRISVCGPKPMMVSVARYAKAKNIPCEVSLENMMACGLGACLCCVEKTVKGNVCVCKEGPVFSTDQLTWDL